MNKKLLLAVLITIIVSYISFADNFIEIEIGGTMIWNPVVFSDTAIGGGVNLAVLPKFTDHFGFAIFFNLAFSPSAALFDFMIGPFFEFNINDKISLVPCAGLYLGMIFFGIGGNLTVQYALYPNISLFARIQYAYAFFLAPGVNSVETSVVSPCVGIGFRF
jgi:hypothetical protein